MVFNRFNLYQVIAGLLVVMIIPSYYFYHKYKETQKLLQNPTQAAKEEAKALKGKISRLIELPKDEEPTVATVTDKNRLKDQPFFKNAENGDRVFIFTEAKKAILYRPSSNKIIEVSFITIGQEQVAGESDSAGQARSSKTVADIVVYNGSGVNGLAASKKREITDKFPQFEVSKIGDTKGSYSKNLIIDLKGNQKEVISELIEFLGGESVTSVPEGEVRPDADILIILGQ